MTLVLYYVYEQDYRLVGWPDDGGGGVTLYSWYDRDLAGDRINLFYIEPGFYFEDDVFLQMPPLTTEVTASFFIDEDVFFTPMSVRVLKQPINMLRNEIVRVR
jgi:hypothetical protein